MRPVPDIVMGEGFELFHRGNSWRGLCPLHDRGGHNPSFVAWETSWKCWSCGESGDGPAFIMKLKGMSYPQALAYLCEERPKPTRQDKAKRIAERKKYEEALWQERELARTLGKMIRLCHKALEKITPDSMDDFALILSELETLTYQHDQLIFGDKADRNALVRELAELRLFNPRTLLFRRDFDYVAWARSLGPLSGATR